MFETVLIANRGEIALRIQRACRLLGLRTVAVYSEADRDSAHVRMADVAVCIGPAPAAQSYLNQAALLFSAEETGADAIHPGYGFLSENAGFAEKVEADGRVFIGPNADTIRRMGDKIAAKQAMQAAGVPCVPGPSEPITSDAQEAHALAAALGYPVMVKAAGGGGGRGMRVVKDAGELDAAIAITAEEARNAFGNPTLYIEKFLDHPRHVEIQVLCDQHGNAIHLGDRDCSLQRRHQKVLEEAPAPGVPRDAIGKLGLRCVEACRQIGYRGLGTFEFLYQDGTFAFIEMNTRVQVEHPVTEMVTGIDLVRAQIMVAMGHALPWRQSDIVLRGHAIECRINAEDPSTFIPSPGTVTRFDLPGGPGIRVDSHIRAGVAIPSSYDAMIAKLIAHGTDRDEALRRMEIALSETVIEGIKTNKDFHRMILTDDHVRSGGPTIHHLENLLKRTEMSLSPKGTPNG
ncbi:acetyl-CoA carboxylase biotin carboxylase subunit [Paraburkholderia sp.]|uniref:acetyl-CoA carboxylase biotin carboxylase subunit n=1 Tax=Paraburkholderia sp. TaxID=1926495 RepID=UPI0039E253AC